MDDKSKKTISAAVWYMITNFISKVLLYIFTPLYTRLLTKAEYGQYNNFLSWQSILIALLTFDLASAISIAYFDYKKEEFDSFVSTITVFSYIIPGVFCLIMLLFIEPFSVLLSIKKEYMYLLFIYITFNNTLNIFQTEQRVRLKYKMSSILTLGTSMGTIALTLIFAFTFQNKLLGILLGGLIINVIVGFVISFYKIIKNRSIKFSYLKYSLVIAVPLIPHVLAGTILGSSDKVMITKYCGDEMTAIYGLAYTISLVVTMIAASINKAWTPWFFDRLKNNSFDGIKKVSNYIAIGVALMSIVICLISPEIMLIVGGEPYYEGAAVMPPVILACLVNCIGTFYVNIEFYLKKTIGISIATVISALINVVLNFFFIRQFGYIAAAYTTLLSAIINLVFHLIIVRKLKMMEIFNNKVILGISLLTTVVCELFILLYSLFVVRYIVLTIVLLVIVLLFIFNRSTVLSVVRALMPSKKEKTN